MDGDVIINQGDPGNTFYVIESGEVRGDMAITKMKIALRAGH